MRWCLDRWRGRAAMLMVLCAFAAPAFAGLDDGVKKEGSSKPEEKNPLIEDAGKRLLEGKVDEAYKLLQEAVAKKPELPPARLMLARLMIASQVREYQNRIRAVLEMAISENPDHPVVYLDNSDLAAAENRVTDAILNAEKALALSAGKQWTPTQKKDVETKAHLTMASAYEARANWEGARSHLSALLKMDDSNGQVRSRYARALFFLDKQSDAFEEFKQAVKNDIAQKATTKETSNMEPANVSMARLWAQKGENVEARKWFEKAIAEDAAKPRVHIAFADWLMQQNEIEQAKLHIDAAAKLKIDDKDALKELEKFQGLILRVQKQYAKAEAIFQPLVNSSPVDVYARDQLAMVLIDQPDVEKQKQAKEHASVNIKNTNEKSPEAWATFAYVAYQLKEKDDALKAISQAVNLSQGRLSRDAMYYAALCLKDKEPEKAKQLLKEAAAGKGLFVYIREASDLRDKLDKQPSPSSSSSR